MANFQSHRPVIEHSSQPLVYRTKRAMFCLTKALVQGRTVAIQFIDDFRTFINAPACSRVEHSEQTDMADIDTKGVEPRNCDIARL